MQLSVKYLPAILLVALIFEGAIMAKKDLLAQYRAKRNFKCTPEPKGVRTQRTKQPLFVIQKHDASHLHYDVRLEIDGVLVSWAVPKGPSTDPRIKRLAVRTEDHPLDYATFEGVIPEGNYGAGTVMVWDYGTYKNIKKKSGKLVPIERCLKDGQVEVWLDGKKLQGGYVFIEYHKAKNQWLLKKIDDEMADARRNPIKTQPRSVLTDRTLQEIARDAKKKATKE
jgi:DNA ligase D-like protein (predicted 3'-phosphoesterase)